MSTFRAVAVPRGWDFAGHMLMTGAGPVLGAVVPSGPSLVKLRRSMRVGSPAAAPVQPGAKHR